MVGFLIISVFAFVFGPNIYAQFMRQTGDAGWGYGYGYGYGYGHGFDGGLEFGYKTDFTYSAADEYGYGFGYGYRASDTNTSFGGTQYQTVPAASIASAVPNLFGVSGTPTSAASLTANDNVAFTAGPVQVLIPSGTVITNGAGGNFNSTALSTASASVTAANIASNASVAGSVQFGVSGVQLFFSKPITVRIPVSTSYNGGTLQLSRSTDGTTWTTTGFTAASTDTCAAGVGSDPVTTAVAADGYITVYTCRASYFASYAVATPPSGGSSGGGGVVTAPACTSVVYGDYNQICFAGYQYRDVISRTPADCALTAAQQNEARRACEGPGVGDPALISAPDSTSGAAGAAFVAAEKALVSRVDTALTNRLKGRILLQVQSKGEAWYVNPVNGLKYYLGRPADAFAAMRSFGLGISNKDFDSYKGKAPARLAGRILLKVEDHGRAYYVNPLDRTMHYLGRPADAFALMRNFGLGITNDNVRKIGVGEMQ